MKNRMTLAILILITAFHAAGFTSNAAPEAFDDLKAAGIGYIVDWDINGIAIADVSKLAGKDSARDSLRSLDDSGYLGELTCLLIPGTVTEEEFASISATAAEATAALLTGSGENAPGTEASSKTQSGGLMKDITNFDSSFSNEGSRNDDENAGLIELSSPKALFEKYYGGRRILSRSTKIKTSGVYYLIPQELKKSMQKNTTYTAVVVFSQVNTGLWYRCFYNDRVVLR